MTILEEVSQASWELERRNQTNREQSCGRGQLQRSQYYRQGGRGFSQIRRPYSYSSGYSVGDPPQTQQRFDGRWHGGYGSYNGAISHFGSRDGGQNNYHGRGHMLSHAHGNLGHYGGRGGCGCQPRCQDVFVKRRFF